MRSAAGAVVAVAGELRFVWTMLISGVLSANIKRASKIDVQPDAIL
jgi:hypothetical protein